MNGPAHDKLPLCALLHAMSAEMDVLASQLRAYEDAVLSVTAQTEPRASSVFQYIDRAIQTTEDLAGLLRMVSSQCPVEFSVDTAPLARGLKLMALRTSILALGPLSTDQAAPSHRIEVF